jgi:FAD/FMN-containing dehydrogenase/Fe-S oxidoreductase
MLNLPVTKSESAAAVNIVGFENALKNSIAGEVRFDRLSRALYSTDASVYQIVPLGVVVPKTEEDIISVVRICGRFHVPVTVRGGGTSQAGQAIGPGLQIDCSKYFNRILEVNSKERWVRVQPGCVLDDLNLDVKKFGLHFPHDISTSNRATLGGMIANNSSGARSVIYGKTIDHVLELRVVLSDGSVISAQTLDESALEAKCRQPNSEGECYRTIRRLAENHAEEIERRYPKILRRVGGYNLDEFVSGCSRAGDVSPLSHPPTQGADAPRSVNKGFNLSPLFVGSEGTLGITFEAKLRLVEIPKAKALLVIQFSNLLDALSATPKILTHNPSAVEVVDKYILDSTRLNPEASRLRDFLSGDPAAILIIEIQGQHAEKMPARLDRFEAELRRQGIGNHYHRALETSDQNRIWKLRKAALGLSMAEKGDLKAISFVEDSAVAPEHLRDYISEFLDVVAHHGTKAGVYAHASVGCLHVRPVINLKTTEGVQQFASIAVEISSLVLKYGGAISGEHGDGLVRSPFQERMFGPTLYQAFREIKRAFDPNNLFNPGKIVDAPPLTANLRYGPAYVTPDIPTTFDFSVDGGLTRAAELCAGVGECRKKREGSMCPSFQATREEQHSTRGRANALRLAITGQLGFKGFTDPALKEVLDLCLECKACKSECPTNVDMARLKAEFWHQYYKKHGLPWRNWVFGNLPRLSHFAWRHSRLSNWLVGTRWIRVLNEKLWGMDRRRSLPKLKVWERRFLAEFMPLLPDGLNDPSKVVLLFPDTFMRYYAPEAALAACKLLHEAGFKLRTGFLEGWDPEIGPPEEEGISSVFCCGRPHISNGLLTKAVRYASHNVDCLIRWANSGKKIIACEPSCILTIKDDYPALLKGEMRKKAETVAAACFTFEEFMENAQVSGARDSVNSRGADATPLALSPARPIKFKPGPKRILVHGHCHQRALVGMEPTMRLLRRIPGAEVTDLDAGCCGMAGSFGYEKEHYEISRLIGEQRLFPSIRKAESDTVIVASGFSCRSQIEHFTGRTAVHPAQLLHSLLEIQL